MHKNGAAVLKVNDNTIIETTADERYRFSDGFRRIVTFDSIGQEVVYNGETYRFVEWWVDETVPDGYRLTNLGQPVWNADNNRVEQIAEYELIATDPTLSDLIVALNSKRLEVEHGGTAVTLGQVTIVVPTSDRAQSKYDAAVSAYRDGTRPAGSTVTLITDDGTPVTIDSDTLEEIRIAVVNHVAACYASYALIYSDIMAEQITTIDAINTDNRWPSNN